MWKIHPLFEAIGKKVDANLRVLPNRPSEDFIGSSGPTTWALVVLNSLEEKDGVWIFSKEEFLTNNVNVSKDWAKIIVAIIKYYEKEIKQTFNNYSEIRWGGHWEDIVKTAKYYDNFGIDGKTLVADTNEEYTVCDQENEFCYPLNGFIFSATQAINRANVLEVL
jgi:hypothetical protein